MKDEFLSPTPVRPSVAPSSPAPLARSLAHSFIHSSNKGRDGTGERERWGGANADAKKEGGRAAGEGVEMGVAVS